MKPIADSEVILRADVSSFYDLTIMVSKQGCSDPQGAVHESPVNLTESAWLVLLRSAKFVCYYVMMTMKI